VTYDDDSYTRITPRNATSNFEDTIYTAGSELRFAFVTLDGVLPSYYFEFERGELVPVTVATTTYSGGAFDIDAMQPSDTVLLDVERVDRSGSRRGQTSVTKQERVTQDFGACSYDAYPVTIEETLGGAMTRSFLFYLPDLGISVIRRIVQPDNSFAEFAVIKIDDDFPWQGRD
jgi:hypothetical protein